MNKDRKEKGLWWDKALALSEGCSPVSEGCRNCWSASQTHIRACQTNSKIKARYGGLTNEKGQFNGKIRLMWNGILKPMKVKTPTVWAVWNDLFHNHVTPEFINDFLDMVIACRHHTFSALTKRPQNIFRKLDLDKTSIKNLYIGTTVENKDYEYRVFDLIKSYSGPKFISVEPMLGPVNIPFLENIDGVICGGESGKNARKLNLDWVRDLRDQCIRTNTPFFFKQTSGFRPKKLPKLDGEVWDQLAWK